MSQDSCGKKLKRTEFEMTAKKKLGRGLDALLGGSSNKSANKPAAGMESNPIRQDKDGDLRHIPID